MGLRRRESCQAYHKKTKQWLFRYNKQMADIKTTLRELGVIYGIIKILKKEEISEFIDFCDVIEPYAKFSKSFCQLTEVSFRKYLEILNNCAILAKAIILTFKYAISTTIQKQALRSWNYNNKNDGFLFLSNR